MRNPGRQERRSIPCEHEALTERTTPAACAEIFDQISDLLTVLLFSCLPGFLITLN
jgi:hypothetical protein